MSTTPPEATAERPDDLGPADSEDRTVSSFARLLAAEDAPATPSPADEQDDEAEEAASADAPPDDEPAEDAEAPDDADEASDDSEEPTSEPTYTVKVDGKVLEVPVSELTKGYQRFADYTRKTTELANERKSLEAEMQTVAQVREEYGKRLSQLADALKTVDAEPDWEKLKAEDPIGFATQWADWQIKAQQRQAVEREHQRVQQEQAQHAQAQQQAFLQAEQQKLLEAVPEWKDPAKAKVEHGRILDYAKARGFREEELAQVYDHRLVLLLRDAARYSQLAEKVKATPVPTTKAAKALSPTLKPTGQRAPVSDLTRQRQRLAKTGKDNDAVPIFLAHLEREGKRR